MIKTVILDLDDTLYDYQAGNRLGMDALIVGNILAWKRKPFRRK